MDAFFQFVFKYPWVVFRKGHVSFDPPLPLYLFILLGLLFLGATFFSYRNQLPKFRRKHLLALITLRTCVFLLLLVVLARPMLRVSILLPHENIAVVLLDDSLSMTLNDENNQERLSAVKNFLKHSHFLDEVEKRFRIRFVKFSKNTERIDSVESLKGNGEITNLKAALENVLTRFDAEPLSSVLLFTDGAANGSREFGSILHHFQQKGVAIYACGLGRESMSNDIELLNVNSVKKALPDSILTADVTLRSNGFEGKSVALELREDGRLVQAKPVRLTGKQEIQTVGFQFAFNGTGLRQYVTTARLLPGELNSANNSLSFVVQSDESRPEILYVEGTPRWEFKFIRQALERDKAIRLMTLLRTSSNKFYRQGIESEDALATGFPTTREELFQYQGLILGSIESSFFSKDQQEMIVDFVGQRGAGFLMLGGKNSFDEGEYANSPIASILPVILGKFRPGNSYLNLSAKVELTEQGRRHPLTQLSADESQNDSRWRQLPNIEEFNVTGHAKPGAVVLASGNADRGTAIFMAVQRYSRGRTVAFTPADSWHWRMEMSHDDDSHEVFWKQVLRWLVSSTPSHVNIELDRNAFFRHETVPIKAIVYDSLYKGADAATVVATIVPPSGAATILRLRSSQDYEGLYTGEYEPTEQGAFEVVLSAKLDDTNLGSAKCKFLVLQDGLEMHNVVQNRQLLEEIARQTGGRYFSLSQTSNLPEEMTYASHPNAVPQTLTLWDIPAFFILICTLLITEWSLRKRVRLG